MENIAVREKVMLGDKTFLKIVLKRNEMIINYELQMITGNKIPFFLEVSRRQTNEEIALMYNISGMKSLEEITAERKLSVKELKEMMRTAAEAETSGRAYQLASRGIMISPEYIFISDDGAHVYFLYLPIYDEDVEAADFGALVKQLISDGKIEVSNDGFISRTIDLINKPGFSYADLREFMKSKASGEVKRVPIRSAAPDIKPLERRASVQSESNHRSDAIKHLETNTIKQQPMTKKESVKDEEIVKKKNPVSKTIIFLLLVLAVVLIILALYAKGVFTSGGQLRTDYLGAAVLAGGGLMFIAYRELFINNKTKKEKGKEASKKKEISISKPDFPSMPEKPNFPNKPSMPDKSRVVNSEEKSSVVKKEKKEEAKITKKENSAKPPKPERPAQSPVSLYGGNDDTEVMDAEYSEEAYLEYYENGTPQKLYINKQSIVLGKQKDRADYCFNENTISKTHAEIYHDGSGYYISDLNSTNGTYINGSGRLESGQMYPICDGDTIRLAKTEMIFHC